VQPSTDVPLTGTPSTAGWLRLSSRISKPDIVQVVRAFADWARGNGHPPSE